MSGSHVSRRPELRPTINTFPSPPNDLCWLVYSNFSRQRSHKEKEGRRSRVGRLTRLLRFRVRRQTSGSHVSRRPELRPIQVLLEIKDTHRPYGGPMLLGIGLP